MADTALRDAERSWAADRDILRESALIQACQRAGTVSREEIELAAYLGHEPAREVQPNCPCWSGRKETRDYHTYRKGCGLMEGPLEHWITELLKRLAALAAPTGLTGPCAEKLCGFGVFSPGTTIKNGYSHECAACGGKGRIPLSPNPEQYYSTVIGYAVAREMWAHGPKVMPGVSQTLGAVAAWLKEPTEERARALAEAAPDDPSRMARMLRDLALLVRETSAFGPILISADALGIDVKAIAREAILPRLRLPPHHHQETT